MTDEMRKYLQTEILKEEWNESSPCLNRLFDNRDDMMDLYQAVHEAGEWKRFLSFAFNSLQACGSDAATSYDMDMPDDKFYNEDFIAWLFNLPCTKEGYETLCEMVGKWHMERREDR